MGWPSGWQGLGLMTRRLGSWVVHAGNGNDIWRHGHVTGRGWRKLMGFASLCPSYGLLGGDEPVRSGHLGSFGYLDTNSLRSVSESAIVSQTADLCEFGFSQNSR